MSLKTEVAIIGAGTAGMVAYRAALDHTPNVLLIDPGPYGTTCARVGCMPSKLLIAAADAAHHVREAAGFGIDARIDRIDGVAVMERVRRERDRFVGGVISAVERWPEAHRLPHRARFIDAKTLRLDDGRTLHAERIVIATGSRPRIPEGWREALGDRLWLNDDVFDWTDLPESVAVVGAGVIGLELGQALHRLGVRVRVFGRGKTPGGLTDPKLAEHAARVLAESMPLALGSRIDEVRREGDGVRVAWHDADGLEHVEHFAGLIAAVGRVANVDGLGLENTDLPLDERGVPHKALIVGEGPARPWIEAQAP
jgi:dihydrolipoamide dehydrogenase